MKRLAQNPIARNCMLFCIFLSLWAEFAFKGYRYFDGLVYDDKMSMQDASILFTIVAAVLTALFLWFFVRMLNAIGRE